MKKIKGLTGVLAFLIVLFAMPLGHAAMILLEKAFGHEHVFGVALVLGLMGIGMLFAGICAKNDSSATFWGFFGSLLVWTGWIEFAFVYYAHRYGVPPLVENGEIVTKPEYLILPSTMGFWAVAMLYYFVGTKSGCPFFLWFQKKLKVKKITELKVTSRNVALTTFNELILVLWTCYLVLLISYDKNFFGDRHPVTYFIAFGSLFWSLYLFFRLLKIKEMGYAIRYAIPTVVIFWNFVEIMGRLKFFKEIWVEPVQYLLEIMLLIIVFILLTIIGILQNKKNTNNHGA